MKIKKFYNAIKRAFGISGKNLGEVLAMPPLPPDFDESTVRIFRSIQEFTMTSPERINELVEAVKYVVDNKIEGDFVECGVWRGGSTMAIAHKLLELGQKDKEIYLYDTFTGMVAPSDEDISFTGEIAQEIFQKTKVSDDASDWCYAPIDEVMKNAFDTGYPGERFHFVKGKVEDTIPNEIPEKIALLRLDTDWYESTRHELIHLFPRLSPYGILIIDDYGCWQGAKKAVDEYILENNLRIFLSRIDSTGRIAIKLP